MVGFGFMDNLVMIQAGDMIDNTIGVALCLSTLTAAACGQVISDASGVCFGGFIEALSARLGVPMSTLTRAQRRTKFVRIYSTGCAAFGVIVGCLLGMTSLLCMDLEKADREKKKKRLASLFDSLMEDGHTLLGAERCTLWLLPSKRDQQLQSMVGNKLNVVPMHRTPSKRDNLYMWSKSRKGEGPNQVQRLEYIFRSCDTDGDGFVTMTKMLEVLNGLGWGLKISDLMELIERNDIELDRNGHINIAGFKKMIDNIILDEETLYPVEPGSMKYEVVKTKTFVNVPDLYSDRRFHGKAVMRTMDALTGLHTLSVLIAPVMNSKGEVLGVIEACNKEAEGVGYLAFTEEDEKLISLLCGHAGRFIEAVS